MKIKSILIPFLFILGLSVVIAQLKDDKKDKKVKDDSKTKKTTLMLCNETEDSVLVYITLGLGDKHYIQNLMGVFGIKDKVSQASIMLAPKQSISYTSKTRGISGNISFGSPPLNCPDSLFSNGINLFEFSLNNYLRPIDSTQQETIDISCVSGVNAIIKCELVGIEENKWNAGTTEPNVTTFKNDSLYLNTGLVGVFPYGCDDCTSIASPPFCTGHSPYATPQSEKICNVQRNSRNSGGVVKILFLGYAK